MQSDSVFQFISESFHEAYTWSTADCQKQRKKGDDACMSKQRKKGEGRQKDV